MRTVSRKSRSPTVMSTPLYEMNQFFFIISTLHIINLIICNVDIIKKNWPFVKRGRSANSLLLSGQPPWSVGKEERERIRALLRSLQALILSLLPLISLDTYTYPSFVESDVRVPSCQ